MARDTSFGQYLRFGQCVRLADGASRRPVCPAARQQRPSSQPELLAPSHVCPARGTQGRPGPAQAPAPWKAAGAGGGGGTGGGCAWGVCARGRARLGGWGGSARAGVPEGDPPPRPRPRARHRTSLSLVSRLPPACCAPAPRRAHPGGWRGREEKRHRALPRRRPRPLATEERGRAGWLPEPAGLPPTPPTAAPPLTSSGGRTTKALSARAAAGKGRTRRPPPPPPRPGGRPRRQEPEAGRAATASAQRPPGARGRAGGLPALRLRAAPPSPGAQVREAAAAGGLRGPRAPPGTPRWGTRPGPGEGRDPRRGRTDGRTDKGTRAPGRRSGCRLLPRDLKSTRAWGAGTLHSPLFDFCSPRKT